MHYSFPPDLQQLIEARLASGRYSTEDEVLRDALRALADEDEDLVAVREAVTQWRSGDPGLPLAAAFDEVRRASGARRGRGRRPRDVNGLPGGRPAPWHCATCCRLINGLPIVPRSP